MEFQAVGYDGLDDAQLEFLKRKQADLDLAIGGQVSEDEIITVYSNYPFPGLVDRIFSGKTFAWYMVRLEKRPR